MNPRRTILMLALAGLAGRTDGVGQEPPTEVTVDQALDLFRRHSPELQIARSQYLGSLGTARQGRAVPNLAAQLTYEDLGEYSESYLLFTQRLEFLWEQGRRGDRADAWTAAAAARFAADSTRFATEVKRTYVTAWERAESVQTLQRALDVVGDVIASAAARVSEGDLAGYDLRRLRWEHARMARRLALAELELEEAERTLGTFVSASDGGPRVRAAWLDPAGPPGLEAGDVVASALAGRAELHAARSAVLALEAHAGLTGASWLTGTNATGGFKRQSDDLNGWFVGLQVPVPVTDRRGGAKDAANAAVREAQAQTALLTRVIARQATGAGARLESARRQRALLGDDAIDEAEQLLGIARLSYDEGEVGIVELLDAARAFVEARMLFHQVQADAWTAFFELEAALGGYVAADDRGANQ